MNEPDEIDHTLTDDVVCPHCGEEHGDSWELSGDGGEMDCQECGKPFRWERECYINYSTAPINKP